MCCCPTTSSSVCGRIRSGSGTSEGSLAAALWNKSGVCLRPFGMYVGTGAQSNDTFRDVSTVGIIPRIASEPAAALAREMVTWLAARGHKAFVEEEAAIGGVPAMPGRDVAARADLLVVLGGDGTLIHAA